MNEDAKNLLNLDTLLTKDGCLNTKRINKLFKQYDLDYLEGDSPVEKTYLLYKDRTYCEVCGKPTPFISWAAGYKKCCSKKCISLYMQNSTKNYRAHCTEEDEARRLEKSRQTCLKKFGVPSASQCKEIQDKIRVTTLERYGCENASQSAEIKKKKEETLLKRYGKTNPFEIPEIKERIKQTNLERHGYDNPFKDPDFHKNLEERNLKLYGRKTVTPLEEIQKKSRETMLKKYGVEYYSQSPEVKRKIAQTWKEKISKIEEEYELHRMCSLLNTQVIGGFSKLIKHSNLDTFISYVDRSLYDGKGYVSCGFKILDKTPPGYFYWLSSKRRLSRIQAQKHKLKDILKEYDANLSELENLHKNEWVRIYDCGNYKVRYDKRRIKERIN